MRTPAEHVGRVRALAGALVHDAEDLLTFKGPDPVAGETFCRALGGGMESSERGDRTLWPEFLAVIGDDSANVRTKVTLEPRLPYGGGTGHRILWRRKATFRRKRLDHKDASSMRGDQGRLMGYRTPLEELERGQMPLHRDGLLPEWREERGV